MFLYSKHWKKTLHSDIWYHILPMDDTNIHPFELRQFHFLTSDDPNENHFRRLQIQIVKLTNGIKVRKLLCWRSMCGWTAIISQVESLQRSARSGGKSAHIDIIMWKNSKQERLHTVVVQLCCQFFRHISSKNRKAHYIAKNAILLETHMHTSIRAYAWYAVVCMRMPPDVTGLWCNSGK